MEAMLLSQRLTRLLTGDPDEGTLPDGAKLHIQNLQSEVDSFMRDYKTINTHKRSLLKYLPIEEYKRMKKIHSQIIDVTRESENAIDTFFVNSIQNKNESFCSQQLCHALQMLDTKFSDIKIEILRLQASQSYQTVIRNSKSIQALVSNSCSSSGTVKRWRERRIINKKPRMVGREDDMERLLDFLIEGKPSLSSITIAGINGYGKTTLAAQVYDNIYVKNYFDCRVWVKMPYVCNSKQLLEAILKSLMPSSGLQEIMEKEDEMKITTLHDYLRNKRYLIVLIDLGWPHRLDDILPDDGNGSRVLATAKSYGDWGHTAFSLRRLNDTESLEMLTDGDFSNESSLLDSETVKRSLKVICDGWPFAITLLRGMLSGKDKQDALQMLEYLCTRRDISSYFYESVPDYLKPCFVYFAVFPENYDISTRQLYQLWIAEGFIEENSETTADMYLEELTMRGFIHVTSRSSTGRIKTCRLHVTLVIDAEVEAKFEWNSESSESFKTCKRLSIRSDPTKFLPKGYSSLNLRSLPWLTSEFRNHTPMECNHILENSKLLKILDLGDLVLNQYPLGIENLVLLRYLKLNIPSLTSIPSSICNLLNLYTLDMPSSHISEAPSDIWMMHKLRHLNFAFIKLPAHPGNYCNSLENLNFISALCPSSFSEDILARLPNLQTLRIYGDLGSHQSMLSKSLAKLLCLESLKFVNESKTPELPSTVLSGNQFPPTLTQLSLSNTELKDDPMPILEKLLNLEVLKLKHNSYMGRTLVCHSGGFAQLRVLHLKSLLWLEEWIMESGAMKKLECLLINPCAYLKRLPEELWHIKTFNQMELWSPRPELKPKLREVEDMERLKGSVESLLQFIVTNLSKHETLACHLLSYSSYDFISILLVLVKHLFAQLLVLKSDSSCPANAGFPLTAEITQEVVETIFCHLAVLASFSCPLSFNEELTKGNLGQSLEEFLSLCQQGVHKIDINVLDMLKTTFEYLLSGQHSILQVENDRSKSLVKAIDALVQRLLLEIRNKFDLCIGSEDVLPLLPGFYALQTLIRFISPFELLELVHWMFSRVNVKQLSACKSGNASALSVGFCIAGGAFEGLSTYLQQPIMKRVPYDLLWSTEEKTFDVNLIEEIYIEICKFATNLDLNIADSCLLKAVHAIYCQNHMQHHNLHPLSYVMSRVVVRTPEEMISHCIDKLNMTKAKFMFLLTKMSPMHLSVFGNILLGTVNKDPLFKGKLMGTDSYALSDEDLMMLLPAALSYLDLNFLKFEKQFYKHFTNIPSFYSSILLNGFRHWKSFVSRYMFQEKYDDLIPSSTEELLNLVDGSLLGKAVHMLRHHFALSGDSLKTKKLVKLFNSICPCSGTHNELLLCDANEINFNSVNQSLNLINKVVAKISLCRMLLFPEDSQIQSLPKEADGGLKEPSLESGSDGQYSSRMRFMNILVCTWQWMVKILPSVYDDSSEKMNKDSLRLYKFLEAFLLRNILELTKKMLDILIQLQSIPFLEQLIRSCLLYRFEDSTTLKMLQSILTSLSEGQFSGVLYLQLLLAHSQFAPSIQSVARLSNVGTGVLLRPMSSILRSLVIPHSDPNIIDGKNHLETTQPYMKQLEIIKLLRTVLQFSSHLCDSESGGDSGINLRELYSLLVSSYGATLGDIDLEIYRLMREIELIDKSDNEIAQFDYLWGGAALKIRKEQVLEQDASSNDVIDTEVVNEQRRRQFRENLPIDPKICAMTVLYFPYDRSVEDGPLSSNKLELANVKNKYETDPPNLENIQRYDPVFILRFSIYSLSVGYIEPVEFAGLGLLAVAFVSMASLDVGMRKLGYEALGRFKDALEMRQRKKEVMRLRLLLTYMQNGIEEPWQRIPSVIAIFAAETSLLLLDPSHDHYTAISKFFMRSSRVNMKCIPLFLDFFSSSSVNFRTERLWILRLAYAGLNLEDDAQIYIRNSILEILLSFYSSPLSDNESKKLILMIVKKSVKLHKMACYLVEHCGLFSWLSSLLPLFTMMLLGDGKRFFLTQLVVVIEVVNDVITSRSITEWLQKHALEQLMELSSRLYKLLVGGVNLIKENVSLVNSILEILISTLKISQKRKMYQPHFTLSLESLLQIYEAVNVCNTANPELGLKAILMSTPAVDIFRMNQEKLSGFLTWAVSTALKSDFGQLNQLRESHIRFTMISKDALVEESLTSKLLRWLVASVILGKLSAKFDDSTPISKGSHTTLLSLLEKVEKGCEGINESRFVCEKILAAAIVHLQQNLGMHCRVLPSVVSALSLLVISDVSKCAGSNSIHGHRTSLPSLLSKIHCPAEANPSWRW